MSQSARRLGPVVAGAVVIALAAWRASRAEYAGLDFLPVRDAAVGLVLNGDPYASVAGHAAYVYPPVSALLFAGLALVSESTAVWVGIVLAALAVAVLAWSSCRLADRGRPWLAVGTLAVLAMAPFAAGSIALANLSALVAALCALALLAARGGRWPVAAVLVALAVAIKPLAVPVVVVFVVARQWRALAGSIGLVGALNAVAALFLADPWAYVRDVLPRVIDGATLPIVHNSSLWALGARHNWPDGITTGLRVGVVLAAIAILWRLSRRPDLEGVALVSAALVPVAAVCLAARVDESHYNLMLVPLSVVLLTQATGLARLLAGAAALAALTNRPLGVLGAQLLLLAAAGVAAYGPLREISADRAVTTPRRS